MDAAERAHPTDPEHDAAIDEVAAHWRPVGVALDAARAALIAWIAEIEAAHGDESAIARVLAAAARLIALYAEARLIVEPLGVELPALPGGT